MKKIYFWLLPLTISLPFFGCMKAFLDEKRDKSQVVPSTLDDVVAMLDNSSLNAYSSHLLGEIGSDDYYVLPDRWRSLASPVEKNGYIWEEDVFQGEPSVDWNRGFEKVMLANLAIEIVEEIAESEGNKRSRDEAMGMALFVRGTNYFNLAQLFCAQYDAVTSVDELGLPIRLRSNVNAKIKRSTLAVTYGQLLDDLTQAAKLLPERGSVATRPSKAAAFGMLAKAYLQMTNYHRAYAYADSALAISNDLLDYHSLDLDAAFPFPINGLQNPEIIYFTMMSYAPILANAYLHVDSTLYKSYTDADLRKRGFFLETEGNVSFKGGYTGSPIIHFSGLTTAELYLIRSECTALMGDVEGAKKDLTTLAMYRYETDKREWIGDLDGEELLREIISERRKELVFRGVRWSDLRRYNASGDSDNTLIRNLDGEEYRLTAGSRRWIWPLPLDAVALGGLEQNIR